MDPEFRFADELGPAKMVYIHEPQSALKAVVAIDNVACGPSIGGVRMATDVSAEEAFRLARAMTFKNAAAGLAHGGGKSVIFADPRMELAAKERLIRAFACAIRDLADYIPGPDMGTDERCMAWIQDEIARSVGLPLELGGIPLDVIGATGFGLAVAVEVAAKRMNLPLKGARVAVQGYGSVGRHAAHFLAEKGAVLVAAADSHATITNAEGLDLAALDAHKARGQGFDTFGGAKPVDRDAVIGVECDIWIPAARPDVVRANNVNRLTAKIVAQGANIPVTLEAERTLHQRGVVSIPDFIANAGGVICAAVEYHGGSQSVAFHTIEDKVRANTGEVLAEAADRSVPPREAAVALAERRVRSAIALRRH